MRLYDIRLLCWRMALLAGFSAIRSLIASRRLCYVTSLLSDVAAIKLLCAEISMLAVYFGVCDFYLADLYFRDVYAIRRL